MSNERVIPVVFLCMYVSWIVTLDDVITLSLPHLFTLYVSLIVQYSISSVFTSHYNTISFPYSSSLCAYRSVWMYKSEHYCSREKVREVQRVKEMQGERRHIFNSPFTFASRSLLFLFFLSFFLFLFAHWSRCWKAGQERQWSKPRESEQGKQREREGHRKKASRREKAREWERRVVLERERQTLTLLTLIEREEIEDWDCCCRGGQERPHPYLHTHRCTHTLIHAHTQTDWPTHADNNNILKTHSQTRANIFWHTHIHTYICWHTGRQWPWCSLHPDQLWGLHWWRWWERWRAWGRGRWPATAEDRSQAVGGGQGVGGQQSGGLWDRMERGR